MLVPNSIIPNPFHNLALFICHLFIDGQFQIGHIIYDRNVLENQLITEIQLNCPQPIPWRITDASQPSELEWTKQSKTTDHILELIFFDPENFLQHFDILTKHFTQYHNFVFTSSNLDSVAEQDVLMKKVTIFRKSTHLIYDTLNGAIWRQGSLGDRNHIVKDNSIVDGKVPNLFNIIFGKYERNWLIILRYMVLLPPNSTDAKIKFLEIQNGVPFFANYYLSKFNATYINRTFVHYEGKKMHSEHQIVHHKYRKYYKELTTGYDRIDGKMLKNLTTNRPNILSMGMHVMPIKVELPRLTKSTQLYPYRFVQLSVLFFYGSDYQRKFNANLFSKLKIFLFNWTNYFVIMAAMVLFSIRRWQKLRRNGLIPVLIDVTVIFTGGGRLRMDQKLERLFFAVVSIGAIFLNAICLGPTMFPSYLRRQQNVEAFQHLARINPPIHLLTSLGDGEKFVKEMLRNKIGSSFNYVGQSFLLDLLQNETKSFAYIINDFHIDQVNIYSDGVRDFDVLEEKLGTLRYAFYLKSNRVVPERLTEKFDKTTSSMIENGLDKFFNSFTAYLKKLRAQKLMTASDENFRVLTIDDLKGPLTVCFYLLIIACLVFLLETIVYRLKIYQSQSM